MVAKHTIRSIEPHSRGTNWTCVILARRSEDDGRRCRRSCPGLVDCWAAQDDLHISRSNQPFGADIDWECTNVVACSFESIILRADDSNSPSVIVREDNFVPLGVGQGESMANEGEDCDEFHGFVDVFLARFRTAWEMLISADGHPSRAWIAFIYAAFGPIEGSECSEPSLFSVMCIFRTRTCMARCPSKLLQHVDPLRTLHFRRDWPWTRSISRSDQGLQSGIR